MFGLFQADLPIGNRLWLTLLAIIVGGSIAATPLSEAASNPVSFGVNLLLLFGQATLISTFSLIIPIGILGTLEISIKRRADKDRDEFFREAEEYVLLTSRASNFLLVAGYVVSIFWIANGNFSAGVGAFGLAVFLIGEVWTEWQDIYLTGYEYLELEKTKGVIRARVIREEYVEKYVIREDWIVLHSYLGDNNWELLDFKKTFALLRRKYEMGLVPQRWLNSFPEPIANMFRKRPAPNRNRMDNKIRSIHE